MTARFISFPLRRFNSLGATTHSRGMVASRSKPPTSKNTMNMNKPRTPQSRPSGEKLDYMLLNLPIGMSMTFIGRCRELDPETLELCAPDGRPVFQVPKSYVTRSNEEETARRIIEDARWRRAQTN